MPATRPLLLLACYLSLLSALPAACQVAISVDATANQHPINPLIYGVAFGSAAQLSDLNAPVNRWGGNSTTRYNWQTNSHNTASDYYYESIGSGTAGQDADNFISDAKHNGAQPMMTIPIIDWIAKAGPSHPYLCSYPTSTFPSQQSVDPFQTNCGNGLDTGGNPIAGADPNTANVPNSTAIQTLWVQHIVNTWQPANQGGLQYYILDNEHSIWQGTHRDVHPNGPGMDEIFQKMRDYSLAVKSVEPNAIVVGPEEWGWDGYFYSGKDQQLFGQGNFSTPDKVAHGNEYYLPWLLDQFHQYEVANGKRLLDVFSVHYYPQGGEYGNDDSAAKQTLRNQSTRSLWDPSYVDQSWIPSTGIDGGKVMLIPRLKTWVAQHYPGLKTAITEYNWGDESRMNGATAQADIYGIFGREGLDIGARWTTPAAGSPAYNAMKMYRNYDGSKSSFGDTSVSTTVPNPDHVSAFSAVRSSDGALTIMLVNKDAGTSPAVSVSLAHFQASGVAHVWQLTGSPGSSVNAINHLSDINFSSSTISLTVPAQSVTLLVADAASFTVSVPNPVQTVVANQTATFTGTLTAFNGYNSPVTITCGSGAPAVCSSTTVTPTPGGAAFSITAGNPVGSNFSFNLVATGSDARAIVQQQPVTLHVSDFAVSVSNPVQTVPAGNTATFNGTLTAQNGYNFAVTVSCGAGAPATCPAASPVTPTAGGAAFSISASSNTTGDYTFNLIATGSDPGPLTRNSQQLTLHVLPSADLADTLSRSPATRYAAIGTPITYTATVTNNGPTATVATLTFTFPINVRITAIDNACTGPGPVVCTSTSLAASAQASFHVTILAPLTHDLKTTATASSATTADPNLSNNTAHDSVRIYLRPFRRAEALGAP
ncbi:MAG TPA: glycoside hydrolase family 44 protein [Terriglobales bacterium]|nr:glycoside hydrolase family 44 protein [Terriglobales bacterium]